MAKKIEELGQGKSEDTHPEPVAFLPKSNLFVVFADDGSRALVWAADEDDLAKSVPGIAFGASLAEIEAIAAELRAEMARALDLAPEEMEALENTGQEQP